jgi:formate/nitrite transporter FocA (FNT family)
MLNSMKNTIMAGIYISLGAIVYLAVPNKIVSACLFAVGILLVLNYHNMLLTKVIPMFFAKLDYKLKDIAIAFMGNSIGCAITATLIATTRLAYKIEEYLKEIVSVKLQDSLLSLLVMAIFCGMLVAYASLTARKYKTGSFAQIFYVWLFISAFVLCGFDHVVANVFYFVLHSILYGFQAKMLLVLLVVLIGNLLGGMFVGIVERKNLESMEEKH